MTSRRTVNTQIELVARMRQRTRLAITGYEELAALRTALRHAVAELGARIEHAPDTPADIIDWLGLPATAGIDGAFRGAALGAFVGTVLDRFLPGLVVGAAVGAVIGGFTGASAVANGWRLRFAWLPTGEPHAVLVPAE